MIGKEKLSVLIQEYYKQNEYADKLIEIFPGWLDSPIINFGLKMFDEVIKAYFTKDGVDWIDYYLYENIEKCYYQDGEKISLETIDDLWNLVKKYRI